MASFLLSGTQDTKGRDNFYIGDVVTFETILDQVIELLQRQGRVSYGAIKRRFDLDDAYLEDIKTELVDAQHLAVDEHGKVLVWASSVASYTPSAERRHLTVMFCDLVESTALASQLDPEVLREVVRAYQATCVGIIRRFEGYVARYMGDGLLVYFGYPQACEDAAQRSAYTGLEIIDALPALNTHLHRALPSLPVQALQVCIGIHTGLVVIEEIGTGLSREHQALGETPNLASRLEQVARPNTVLISEDTYRLVQGYVVCDDVERQALKGASEAETCFRKALEMARCQRAKWWELRAATSLSRWLEVQGQSAEARQVLMDAYAWFSEGEELADLQEARLQIERLASGDRG